MENNNDAVQPGHAAPGADPFVEEALSHLRAMEQHLRSIAERLAAPAPQPAAAPQPAQDRQLLVALLSNANQARPAGADVRQLQCGICLQDCGSDVIILDTCGHYPYCQTCILNICNGSVEVGPTQKIRCPHCMATSEGTVLVKLVN